jgi:hypothetical protein
MDPDVLFPAEYLNGVPTVTRLQYEWDANPYFDEGVADYDWNNRYEKVLVYNVILTDIDQAPLGNRNEKDRIRVKGEALAERAFEFYLLVNEYAAQYSPANLDKPGIPLPLEVNLTAQLSKSTIGEVYAQIEKDLDEAIVLLDDHLAINSHSNFRPGKASLFALQAMIALQKGNFPEAERLTDLSLEQYDFIYDMTTISNKVAGNAWSGINNTDFTRAHDNKDVLWNRTHRTSYTSTVQFIHDDLLNLFDQENDQRFLLFSSNKTNSGADVSPYTAYARTVPSQAGLGVAEIMLVSAEAKVRNGDLAGAVDRINELLKFRIFNFEKLSTSDFSGKDELLTFVKNERRKELMSTGKNLFDLKRYHAYGDQVSSFLRSTEEGTIELKPGSDAYIVPVATAVKVRNPNL